jgi:hypothetical protein
MNKPAWVKNKEAINKTIEEKIVIVGKMGVDGVSEGKLPNGDDYEWSKQHRSLRRKWRIKK